MLESDVSLTGEIVEEQGSPNASNSESDAAEGENCGGPAQSQQIIVSGQGTRIPANYATVLQRLILNNPGNKLKPRNVVALVVSAMGLSLDALPEDIPLEQQLKSLFSRHRRMMKDKLL